MGITLSKVRSTLLEAGKRILKVEQFGVKTVDLEVSSFGDDGNPIENMTAIYADTSENGEPVIIGYVNENQLANVGEKRIYSLNINGGLSTYIWLRNNGNIEIGGTSHNAVRYAPLNTGIQSQTTGINAELAKISTAIGLLGGTYVVAPVTADISGSEVSDVFIK